ncbi:MAG: thioredoxin domain-containing protein [Candidatus Saccharimonadales bacterium]
MGKGFWAVLVLVVAVMISSIFIFGDRDSQPRETIENPHEITAEDHKIGSEEDTAITLVKYSDFQCPACQTGYSILPEVREHFGDDLLFVYRHSPFLPQAYDAARATEAAAEQGMFWEMHDTLFDNQASWSGNTNARSLFESYAEDLDMDVDQFRSDFQDAGSRVERDVAIRDQIDVIGTPTYFINGERLQQNPQTAEMFISIIEGYLE